jgi:DNA-binding NtrC family response regulator
VRELKNVVGARRDSSRATSSPSPTCPEDPHQSPFADDDETGTAVARAFAPGQRPTLREYRESVERSYIVDTLKEADWNVSKARVTLGVERTNLHKKIRAYAIKRGEG